MLEVAERTIGLHIVLQRRTACGDGFGIPLVLRYVLETAQDTASAIAILQRVPTSRTPLWHIRATIGVYAPAGRHRDGGG